MNYGFDLYQIIVTHNRPWSRGEIAVFVVVLLSSEIARLYRTGRIRITQLDAVQGLLSFLRCRV